MIAFAPPDDVAPLDEALSRIDRYDWVIFTSANGVRYVSERLSAAGQTMATLAGALVGAIVPATADALEAQGITTAFVPNEFVAEAVIAQIGDVAGSRILLPRADIAREALATGLEAKGALVEQVVAYRTVLGEPRTDVVGMLRRRKIDAVTFTSSSTVKNFISRLETSGTRRDDARELLEGVTIAAIGPITARTVREYGLDVTIEAEHYTVPGLVDALAQAIGATRPQPEETAV